MITTKNTTQQKLITSFVVVCVMVVLAVATEATKQSPHSSTNPVVSHKPTSSMVSNATYKDGQYTATGMYNSPGGQQAVHVTVTLRNNKIADATVIPEAQDGVAQVYQSYFVHNFKSYVIGKDISGLKLSRVAGSSLTSQGFNNALDQIKQQAKTS